MNLPLDPGLRQLNDCGCCEGVTVCTPVKIDNRPGLSAIAYRVGSHSRFRESLLARLSDPRYAKLRDELRTRDDDDFAIALLDAWSTVADVLTFYQERIANESYLRTATELRSLLELARLVGYAPRPGMAASTWLAFSLEDAPGAPRRTIIDIGTRVQSIPGPGEQPQTFETVEQIEARPEWNALGPRLTELRWPAFGDDHIFLKGTTTHLKPGDALLIVGQEREQDPGNEHWEFRRTVEVKTEPEANRTLVKWGAPLGHQRPRVEPPKKAPRVYALRLRAAVFGHNVLSETDKFFQSDAKYIPLDSVYSQIVTGSWVVLSCPRYEAELFQVKKVEEETNVVTNKLAAKTTNLYLSGERIQEFSPRSTTVFAQSELLEIAEQPLTEGGKEFTGLLMPVQGNRIDLGRAVDGLEKGKTIIVSGKRLRARVADNPADAGLALTPVHGFPRALLQHGESLQILRLAKVRKTGIADWFLKDRDCIVGHVAAALDMLNHVPAWDEDEMVAETAIVENASGTPTTITLQQALKNVYDRATVTIHANVVRATHGESLEEILGAGDSGKRFQEFSLRQPPLTHIGAATPKGTESTLQVRVHDHLWQEVPNFYGRGPEERVYVTATDDSGKTVLRFGDGGTGARLPTGRDNVRATYRKGIGRGGNVKADQLSLLLTRPLGVKGVINPLPAEGGSEREGSQQVRSNIPLQVLTLDRIVSLKDYEDFARSFAGIAKALASWNWCGEKRGVFLTVAGPDGAEIDEASDIRRHLLSAMKKAGDPSIPLVVSSYCRVPFGIHAAVKVEPDHASERVLESVRQALDKCFSFDSRAFGQAVFLSEVMAVIHSVEGVFAVDVDRFFRIDGKDRDAGRTRLTAAAPRMGTNGTMVAAELLMLGHRYLELKEMP